MQGYQQRLIFFALFIIVTYAETKINSFNAFELETADRRSTVYANHVQLWANVTDCSQFTCVCQVKTAGLEDEPRTLKFSKEKGDLGSVEISNLESNTNYSFILTCKRDQSSVNETLNIKTDYGRPSAPKFIKPTIVSKRVQVTWLPPLIPADSFTYYKITIDKESKNISKNDTSYQMPGEYEQGTKHIFNIAACYENNQAESFCSNSSKAETSFVIPVTVTPKSTGVHSYYISISMIIFSLSLVSKMKW